VGIHLDENLTWNPHFKAVKNKTSTQQTKHRLLTRLAWWRTG